MVIEMVFTLEDAENDGLIKNEMRPELTKVAKSHSQAIYRHFEKVCNSMDQEPGRVLTDMLVRCLNDEEYAQGVANTEVSMEAINTGEVRKEDIQFVKEIAKEFDLEPEKKENPVNKIIEQRLEHKAATPFDNIGRVGEEDVGGSSRRQEREIRKLESKIQELEAQLDEDDEVVETEDEDVERRRKEVDELFDDEEEEDVVDEIVDSGVEEDDEEDEVEVEEIEQEDSDEPMIEGATVVDQEEEEDE